MNKICDQTAFLALLNELRQGKFRGPLEVPLLVPDILVHPFTYECKYVGVSNAREFILDSIDCIQRMTPNVHPQNRQSKFGSTFLVDLRSHASFSRRHGSFLSLIPWLAHFVRWMGCQNVVLLPLGPYGKTRRKGVDGSLFALLHHAEVADEYRDCLIPDLDATTQYRAVVELAARAGVRVGTVQPLCTAALDCEAFARDPSLTFWWAADPSEVLFSPVIEKGSTLSVASITDRLRGGKSIKDASVLIPKKYAERFVEPPSRSSIRLIHRPEGTYFVGKSLYKGRMIDVSIANAIPDVIPNVEGTYAWRDVASLNYWCTHVPSPFMLMGLEKINKNSSAMKKMIHVMHARSNKFGESVFWVDMARCLPENIRNSAPHNTHLFSSTKIIYEQITGSTPLDKNRPATVAGEFLSRIAPRSSSVKNFAMRLFDFLSVHENFSKNANFFAGPGTHDSLPNQPRINALLLLLSNFMPCAEPLIVSGQERFVRDAINGEFGEFGDEMYCEANLSIFTLNSDRSASGIPVKLLSQQYNLPPTSILLKPAFQLRGFLERCLRSGLPEFGYADELGCWTFGREAEGPWATILLSIRDAGARQIPLNRRCDIALRPLTHTGWVAEYRPSRNIVSVDNVDLVIIGGKELKSFWQSMPRTSNESSCECHAFEGAIRDE